MAVQIVGNLGHILASLASELVCDGCETGFRDCDTYRHRFFKLAGAVPIISMMRYRASIIARASNQLRQLPILAYR